MPTPQLNVGDTVISVTPSADLVFGKAYIVRWIDHDGLIWVDIGWRKRGGYLPIRFKKVCSMYKFSPGEYVELATREYGNYGTASNLSMGKMYIVQPRPSYANREDTFTYLINDTGELEAYITQRFKRPNLKNGSEIFGASLPDNNSNGGGLKYDGGKLLFRALTRGLALPLRAVAAVLTYGAAKYKIDSWQTVPNGADRYEDALDRHLNSWKEGERFDEESGLHHLAHAACNVLFLLWYEMTKNPLIDYTKFNNPNGNK